jgi:hypothetical protein
MKEWLDFIILQLGLLSFHLLASKFGQRVNITISYIQYTQFTQYTQYTQDTQYTQVYAVHSSIRRIFGIHRTLGVYSSQNTQCTQCTQYTHYTQYTQNKYSFIMLMVGSWKSSPIDVHCSPSSWIHRYLCSNTRLDCFLGSVDFFVNLTPKLKKTF